MINEERLNRIIVNMKEQRLSQILITSDTAFKYLIGMEIKPMERAAAILVKDNGDVHAYMNDLFCVEPIDGVKMHYYADSDDPYALIGRELAPGKLGIDDAWMAKHLLSLIAARPDVTPVRGSAPVDMARECKAADELDKLRHASAVNDKAVSFAIKTIAPDVDELTLADSIEEFFEQNGAASEGQFQICCFGTGAAEPHHEPEKGRFIREGECCLIDICAPIDGYWCDMTRTVFYKSVSDEHRKIYEVVKAAQQAGIDFVRPGIKMCDVDKTVRKVIEDAGYGEYFLTRTGHGIGMSVHEPPFADAKDQTIAKPGMVFSIEPGIYIKGDVGVRIEDLVIVTEDGCEVLTKYPKELIVV